MLKDCRICSSEKALLSASKQEEYCILKDHTVYDSVAGKLTAKYPFSQDPSVLTNNSSQALGARKSHERCQLKNGTNKLYVQQFEDMVKCGVVSKLTEKEKAVYKGPVNYIMCTSQTVLPLQLD